ncbi:MBL fold metallo-hydrolase [Paenibacillus sp. UNC499MF]|uniref:MBL fold metallo-hydrolase n=1 Tax=Paenibacillus sp. UNC499MF TaxID=1502751 RepID=UPI0008A0309B|nr:MBL fold metallo-hydrolase [Paenibacillus sp. UNC499MF]SEG59524.1 Glyoxylase, beta-lactamase superfamily II [Paenibacillus sp. UNC499MF]
MQVRKRLFLLSGGTYGKLGNAYAIKHSEGYVLVDSSNPGALDTLLENLNYWGISEQSVTHVLLTHGHDDHAGCAAYFQKQGARIYVGAPDKSMMETGNFGPQSPYTNHVMPPCIPDQLFTEDTQLHVGDLTIYVYLMPGHSDGSVLFYLKLDHDTVLFTGDMFFPDGETGSTASTGWKGDLAYSADKLGESFSKLWQLSLEPTIIAGGHGIPRIGNNAKDSIQIAYKYYLLNNR